MFSCAEDRDSKFSFNGIRLTDLDDAAMANFLASDSLNSMSREDRRHFVELLKEREVLRLTRNKTEELQRVENRAINKSKLGNADPKELSWLLEGTWEKPQNVPYVLWAIRHSCRKWTKFFTKIFRKSEGKDGALTINFLYFLRIIPFVNLMVDLFFDNSPIGSESVKSLLDILGLLNALLLGVAISIMSSVTYDDATEADVRYGFGNEGDNNYWPGADLAPPAGNTKPNYFHAWVSWWAEVC